LPVGLAPTSDSAGENVYYVSRQLGHASTKLTLDTYGDGYRRAQRQHRTLRPTDVVTKW
jgi:hypothetical protein